MRLRVVLLTLALLLGTCQPAHADSLFVLHVAADGNNANDGLTPETPVKTLEAAEGRLAEHDVDADVEIRIAPGVYVAPTTYWQTMIPGHTITFLPEAYQYSGSLPPGGRPVFKSDGSPNYWLWANWPAGQGGNAGLRFYYLEVTGYGAGGIAAVGRTKLVNGLKRPDPTGSIDDGVIYGMNFHHLGTRHSTDPVGYGAIVIHNGDDWLIQNNHTNYLENDPPDTGAIHSIYLAHGADRNRIVRNSFRWVTGGPVRVRNDSDGNIVQSNVFYRTSISPVGGVFSEWSCTAACAATYHQPAECGSHGNVAKYNTWGRGYDGRTVPLFSRSPSSTSYVGPAGCTSDSEPWLATNGNVYRGPD